MIGNIKKTVSNLNPKQSTQHKLYNINILSTSSGRVKCRLINALINSRSRVVAAIIYVDNRLFPDIHNGTYATATRVGGGTDGNVYGKI